MRPTGTWQDRGERGEREGLGCVERGEREGLGCVERG